MARFIVPVEVLSRPRYGDALLQKLGRIEDQVSFESAQKLGSGSLGDVVRVHCLTTGQALVAKAVPLEKLRQREVAESRICHEAEVLRGLHHPNIVKLVGVFAGWKRLPCVTSDPPYVCTVMECVEHSESLSHAMLRGGAQPSLAFMVLPQLANALATVHAAGFVHRDVWAENVLIERKPGVPAARVVLVDFGNAERVDGTVASTRLNVPYASPEVWSRERQQPGDDAWALGLLVTEMVTGQFLAKRMGRTDVPIHQMPKALQAALAETVSIGGPILGDIATALLRPKVADRISVSFLCVIMRDLNSRPRSVARGAEVPSSPARGKGVAHLSRTSGTEGCDSPARVFQPQSLVQGGSYAAAAPANVSRSDLQATASTSQTSARRDIQTFHPSLRTCRSAPLTIQAAAQDLAIAGSSRDVCSVQSPLHTPSGNQPCVMLSTSRSQYDFLSEDGTPSTKQELHSRIFDFSQVASAAVQERRDSPQRPAAAYARSSCSTIPLTSMVKVASRSNLESSSSISRLLQIPRGSFGGCGSTSHTPRGLSRECAAPGSPTASCVQRTLQQGGVGNPAALPRTPTRSYPDLHADDTSTKAKGGSPPHKVGPFQIVQLSADDRHATPRAVSPRGGSGGRESPGATSPRYDHRAISSPIRVVRTPPASSSGGGSSPHTPRTVPRGSPSQGASKEACGVRTPRQSQSNIVSVKLWTPQKVRQDAAGEDSTATPSRQQQLVQENHYVRNQSPVSFDGRKPRSSGIAVRSPPPLSDAEPHGNQAGKQPAHEVTTSKPAAKVVAKIGSRSPKCSPNLDGFRRSCVLSRTAKWSGAASPNSDSAPTGGAKDMSFAIATDATSSASDECVTVPVSGSTSPTTSASPRTCKAEHRGQSATPTRVQLHSCIPKAGLKERQGVETATAISTKTDWWSMVQGSSIADSGQTRSTIGGLSDLGFSASEPETPSAFKASPATIPPPEIRTNVTAQGAFVTIEPLRTPTWYEVSSVSDQRTKRLSGHVVPTSGASKPPTAKFAMPARTLAVSSSCDQRARRLSAHVLHASEAGKSPAAKLTVPAPAVVSSSYEQRTRRLSGQVIRVSETGKSPSAKIMFPASPPVVEASTKLTKTPVYTKVQIRKSTSPPRIAMTAIPKGISAWA